MSKRLCQSSTARSIGSLRLKRSQSDAAHRLKQPVFLSIDLPLVNARATGISSETAGKWLLLIEKLVVQTLDEDARSAASLEPDVHGRISKMSLQGELVGR